MTKMHRCRWDKKIGGVCGGLGQYYQVDPTVVRCILICLTCLTAVLPFVIAYIIAWILLPLGPTAYVEIKSRKLYRSRTSRKVAGICGGIGEALRVDPVIVRVVYLIVMIFTGIIPLGLSYLIGCAVIPERPN